MYIFHCAVNKQGTVAVLLAVGVIYHAIDMDLFAHVHGQDECEPTGAEVGPRLDPAKHKNTECDLHKNGRDIFFFCIEIKTWFCDASFL